MKLFAPFAVSLGLVSCCFCIAVPPKPPSTTLVSRADVTDLPILNFLLMFEHAKAAFYTQGLSNFSQPDFLSTGYAVWTRGRYEQVLAHEKSHVEFLTAAINGAGAQAVQPCTYNFPVENIKSFATLSHILETVGTSAYNGAVAFIENKAYLTVAASILGAEARHAAWMNSAVLKSNAWHSAFETPLDFNQAYTLISPFITLCPESNPAVPAKAFAILSIALLENGSHARLSYPPLSGTPQDGKPLHAAFLVGTGTVFMPVNMSNNEVEVPANLLGVVYVVLTSDGGRISDETTVAGPAFLQFPFDSRGVRINNGTTL